MLAEFWMFDAGRATERPLRGLWAHSTFGNFCQTVFFDDKSPEGESENRRVFTGDLNGGLGVDLKPPYLALIRVAWLGFTTTYKTAGTPNYAEVIQERILWVGLWVRKSRTAKQRPNSFQKPVSG